jgi:hypothetical protein
MIVACLTYGLFMMFSDYVSLFVVKAYLKKATNHPLLVLLISMLSGTFIITCMYILMISVLAAVVAWGQLSIWQFPELLLKAIPATFTPKFLWIMTPGLIVHVWLLLFAVAALGVRLLNPIIHAVRWAQWFLTEGNQHPLRAIGLVAAVLAFAVMAIGTKLAA